MPGLSFQTLQDKNTIEIVSDRIFIDKSTAESIVNSGKATESILTYLVNSIQFQDNVTPYSFASAISNPVLGIELKENETIINQWLADDLGAGVGTLYSGMGERFIQSLVERNFNPDIKPTAYVCKPC